MSLVSPDPQRLALAAAAIALYALLCVAIAWRERTRRRVTEHRFGAAILRDADSHWRIVYASQTGSAEELARHTAETLHLAGIAVQLNALSDLNAAALARAERVLFVVSTYGEGNPPDNAAAFVQHVMGAQRVMTAAPRLDRLHYALLSLGDSSYVNFCGFGRELDGWLQAQGAQPLYPTIEVDRGDTAAIEAWRRRLSHLAGTDDAPDWQGPAYENWRLAARALLNPGSQGGGVFHIELEPADGAALPAWESGDLVQIRVPGETRPREYSIASIPADGRVHLLIRLHRHRGEAADDDSFGAASGWLTRQAPIGATVALRLRPHARFRLGDNAARPLILIGNGTGIAGLRGHLKTRAHTRSGAAACWLIFGERNAHCDYHYRADIEAWTNGVLERLDTVFSRDQPERRHVQHRLHEVADSLRAWIERGAAIYVCGSLKGMAGGVDDALAHILGRAALEELACAGRYRRDVY